jgi:hypothetical protein
MFVIIYLIIAYCCLTSLQNKAGIFYFGTFSDYFFGKLVISLFFGWLAIPIWIIAKLIGKL